MVKDYKMKVKARLFYPVLTVKAAIAYGFGDVVTEYALRAVEIGNSTCNLENAVVGTCREIELLHGCAKALHTGIVECSEFLKKF